MTHQLYNFAKTMLLIAAMAAAIICFSGCAVISDLNRHCKVDSANNVGADFRVCLQCDSLAQAVKDWVKPESK